MGHFTCVNYFKLSLLLYLQALRFIIAKGCCRRLLLKFRGPNEPEDRGIGGRNEIN